MQPKVQKRMAFPPSRQETMLSKQQAGKFDAKAAAIEEFNIREDKANFLGSSHKAP
jgi:hypothetical protein